MYAFFDKLSGIDRRWIFLLIGLGTLMPILMPIGLPVSITPPVQATFDRLDQMGPDDVILLSIDYGPTTEAECAPMTKGILRHCFSRNIKVVMIALFPIGALSEGTEKLADVVAEFDGLEYGVDYINLGFKEGAQATMRQLNDDIHGVFPNDVNGDPVGSFPLMQEVHGYPDISAVISIATGVIGEYWMNLVNAQYGLPVAVGCTAVSAPRYYSFYEAGQAFGLMGGLKAASEYERLLIDGYPEHDAAYSDPTQYTAIKGMDVQTIDHAIIILFIILGNLAYLATKRRERVA